MFPPPRRAHCWAAPWLISMVVLVCSRDASANFMRWSSYQPASVNRPCPAAAAQGRVVTGMWGCNGENWEPSGPLTDFSFAGYGAGLETIPNNPVTVDIKQDYKAAGDGVQDDTAAVLAALEATKGTGAVIYFPPGRYLLSKQLNLSSHQVLRGAGRDATSLHFTKSLVDLYTWGARWQAGRENSPYTWTGALISTQREQKMFNPADLYMAAVARPALRGDTRLYLKDLAGKAARADAMFVPGQWVNLAMYETMQADFARALINNKTQPGKFLSRDFGGRQMFSHMSRVLAAGQDWIDLERPLHVDVDAMFSPTVYRTPNFKVVGVGVEDLEISFPWTIYLGHHEEPGWNAIEYEAAVNSWVRRIRVVNADAAVKFYSTMFSTISDVEVTITKPRRGGMWNGRPSVYQPVDKDGHMGVALHWACFDNLIQDINVINGIYYHELAVAGYSAHNVFMRANGTDVCMDHHGAAPHNNLWTEIELGLGQAAMRWSGSPGHNPYGGMSNVFWGIAASRIPVSFDYIGRLSSARMASSFELQRRQTLLEVLDRPASEQGYGQVVVDMPLSPEIPTIQDAGDWYIQYNPTQRAWPPNLFQAMQATQSQRLKLSPTGITVTDYLQSMLKKKPSSSGSSSSSANRPSFVVATKNGSSSTNVGDNNHNHNNNNNNNNGSSAVAMPPGTTTNTVKTGSGNGLANNGNVLASRAATYSFRLQAAANNNKPLAVSTSFKPAQQQSNVTNNSNNNAVKGSTAVGRRILAVRHGRPLTTSSTAAFGKLLHAAAL